MTTPGTVRLLDVEPDLGRYLTAADVEALAGLVVPELALDAGPLDMAEVLATHHAFGAIVLDGLLVRRIGIGQGSTLVLLGPGDVVGDPSGPQSILVGTRSWSAGAPTRIALLEREALLGAHRAPRFVAGLHARTVEQAGRVAVQLAICQLPRVEDRVVSLRWHLAETWGQVTAHGTALRLHLTHETIGGLVGARRSTVTLALKQLTEEGAILRQDRGWLLLEAPANGAPEPARTDPGPELLEPLPQPAESSLATRTLDVAQRVAELREIRRDLASNRERIRRRVERELERLRESRELSRELLRQAHAHRASFTRLHHDDDAGDGVWATEGEADDAAAEWLSAAVDGIED